MVVTDVLIILAFHIFASWSWHYLGQRMAFIFWCLINVIMYQLFDQFLLVKKSLTYYKCISPYRKARVMWMMCLSWKCPLSVVLHHFLLSGPPLNWPTPTLAVCFSLTTSNCPNGERLGLLHIPHADIKLISFITWPLPFTIADTSIHCRFFLMSSSNSTFTHRTSNIHIYPSIHPFLSLHIMIIMVLCHNRNKKREKEKMGYKIRLSTRQIERKTEAARELMSTHPQRISAYWSAAVGPSSVRPIADKFIHKNLYPCVHLSGYLIIFERPISVYL